MKPEPYPHRIIRASAGAGKTHTLSNHYLSLLRHGAQPGQILATTFTRKAAGEILGRVLTRLAQAAGDPHAAGDLAKQLDDPSLGLDQAHQMLQTMVDAMHQINVSTIDSFFHRMAMCYRYELGLPATPRLIDDHGPVARQLRRSAIDAMLADETPDTLVTLLRHLHHDQAKRRISDALDELFVALYDVYRQTDKDAWHRIQPLPALDPAMLTQALALLRAAEPCVIDQKSWLKAWATDLQRAEKHDWPALLKTGIAKAVFNDNPTYRSKKPLPDALIQAYRPLVQHAANEQVNRVVWQTRATYELLERFDKHYTQLRHSHGVLLFSDLTYLLSKQANDAAMLDELYFRLDTRVQHLLLDEFQDTSPLQWRVLRPFAQEVTAHQGDHALLRSFFCVGDIKQSIYGWRGGRTEVFDRMVDDLHLPPSCVSTTSVSYRSSQVVLDVVNQVFDNVADIPALETIRSAAAAWGEGFEPHTAHHADRQGYVELLASPCPEQDAPDQPSQEPPSHELWCAQRIADLAHAHPTRTIGILMRTNKRGTQLLALLRMMGVNASGEGGATLDDEPAVELILAALIMADHPGHSAAAQRVHLSPLAQAIELQAADPISADKAARRIRRQLIDEGYGQVIARWSQILIPHCHRRGIERLTQLIDLAQDYDPALTLRASDFVDHVRATKVEDPTPAPVRVMTIHKAKGLQFDLVVLCELSGLIGQVKNLVWTCRQDLTLPPAMVTRSVDKEMRPVLASHCPDIERAYEQEQSQQVSDDLSALYVAMTRAKHAMHMWLEPLKKTARSISAIGLTNRSSASLLRQRLTDIDEPLMEGMLYQKGTPHWDDAPCDTTPIAPTPHASLTLAKASATRSWAIITPSSLEHDGQVDVAQLFNLTNRKAMDFGTHMHHALEQVEYLTPDQMQQADKPLSLALRHASVREALTRRHENETLWRERPFVVRQGNRLLRGTFDRVMIDHDQKGNATAARLIDFKTDTYHDATAQRYRPQLQAYRQALAQMLTIDPSRIQATLLFVMDGQSVTL